MKLRLVPLLVFVALMVVLMVLAHIISGLFGHRYQYFILLGGMLLAWFALHWYSKRQESQLREDVADWTHNGRRRSCHYSQLSAPLWPTHGRR
jgi:small neutral amino acid transporter SnatA (MarC family)